MRKCLGVLVTVAALCLMSWSQAPNQTPPSTPPPSSSAPAPAPDTTQTPPSTPAHTPPSTPVEAQPKESTPTPARSVPQFPRVELFGGYSFAQAGFYNAGHWAQLNGWNASFALNAFDHLGLVVDASQFFGNSQIPSNSPAPFQNCTLNCPPGTTFNADTREYNVLFGVQMPFHRRERWTPFGELMFGHDGVRGKAPRNNIIDTEVSSGLALVAGAGADYKINERFALRFKADYLATHTSFPALGKKTQDNLRLSVGVVIRSVRKKKRTLEEDTPPE